MYLRNMDRQLQIMGGGYASEWGQSYDVRRLDGATNVSVQSNAAVIPGFLGSAERTTAKVLLENQTFEILTFELTCNRTNLQIFDQLTETGFGAEPEDIFVIASMRPTRPTIAVRAESAVSITRQMPTAGAASQQPTSGNTFISGMDGWSGTAKSDELVLTLIDGVYAFAAPGATAASVQVGLEPTGRIKDGNTLAVPTEIPRAAFVAYCPMLPGAPLVVEDRFNLGSARYEITKLFNTNTTGLAGYILMLEAMQSIN
jgi:hypothetical protein